MVSPPTFVHLHTHSAFSFGDGASGVEELVLHAAALGMPGLALTDTMSLSGIPSLVRGCNKAGIHPIAGCEIVLEGGSRLTLLADGPAGFSSLCRLLSAANLRDVKRRGARVRWEDLESNTRGIVCLTGADSAGLLPRFLIRQQWQEAYAALDQLTGIFGRENVCIEVTRSLTRGEHTLSLRLLEIADYAGLTAVAANRIRHATKMGMAAHEALRRVALHLAPEDEHGELPLNAECYLKSPADMHFLFADRVDVLENTVRLARRLAPPLDPAVRHLPHYPRLRTDECAHSLLTSLTCQGMKTRYSDGVNEEITRRVRHELETIRDLGYSDYFLICKDVCDEARRRQIGFALRGSAVGSVVAYCLHMSPHDPIARRISFERFLSKARKKAPDIDIDFRHDERDHLMEYTRKTYGEDKVAGIANYVCWKGRSLLRDIGRVLGFDTDEMDRLRELLWHSRGDDLAEKLRNQPELRALNISPDRYADLFALCASLANLPRHLGTHCSGLVVSDIPLSSVCPIAWAAKGVTIACYDKDDVESPGIGLLKMDQLSLRALTAVDITVDTVRRSDPEFDYDARDREDGETLSMIRAAQTIGVFQLESPAQMALQSRLQADRFADLIASVALIRPGPLVGGTVTPYIAARKGRVKPSYLLPELEPILAETYGRIIFQDQVLEVVAVVGGYSMEEADIWLKTMTHARSQEEMERLGLDLLERARSKGVRGKRFERLWKQIKGFSRYGFCEGHAVAFASHAQGTAYLLRHYPAEFLAGTLSVEPCGFWPVMTVTAEAVRRGVGVLPPCLNRSSARQWRVESEADCPTGKAIRCSLAAIRTVSAEVAEAIMIERKAGGPFLSLMDVGSRLWFVPRDVLEWMTLAGGLDQFCPVRRQILWSLPAIHHPKNKRSKPTPGQETFPLTIAPLFPPDMQDFSEAERFSGEWQALGFSPSGHPMRFYRKGLQEAGVFPCATLQSCRPGSTVTIGGLCLRPHRPPTPSGQIVVFMAIEDETGLAQVTVPPAVYETFGSIVFGHTSMLVTGRTEAQGDNNILIAQKIEAMFSGK